MLQAVTNFRQIGTGGPDNNVLQFTKGAFTHGINGRILHAQHPTNNIFTGLLIHPTDNLTLQTPRTPTNTASSYLVRDPH